MTAVRPDPPAATRRAARPPHPRVRRDRRRAHASRWSPATDRSTGSACRTSTRRASSAPFSTSSGAAASCSRPEPPSGRSGATCRTRTCSRRPSTPTEGRVRVTDAMTLPRAGLAPARELVRRVEGIAGEVPMRWRFEPRFGYASRPARIEHARRRARRERRRRRDRGPRLERRERSSATPRPSAASSPPRTGRARCSSSAPATPSRWSSPPATRPKRGSTATIDFWRGWAGNRSYEGPWREPVIRSALALKLLVHAPSGAIAAAATTSLPEALGGVRNWDYRYSWPRDSAFTLDAFLALGCSPEADAYFSWLLHASHLTHPRLQVLYRLDGGTRRA